MPSKSYWAEATGRKVRVPSVTTVLRFVGDKGGLYHWNFMQGKEAALLEAEGQGPFNSVWDLPKGPAETGTVAHAMIEADLTGATFARDLHPADVLAEADEAFKVWLRWKEKRKLEVVATECSMVSESWMYGGTVDLVAYVDGELTLMDFKTGSVWAEHLLQVAAYARMWAETQDKPLEHIGLMRLSKTDGGLHQHFWPAASPTMIAAREGFQAALKIYDVLARKLKKAT